MSIFFLSSSSSGRGTGLRIFSPAAVLPRPPPRRPPPAPPPPGLQQRPFGHWKLMLPRRVGAADDGAICAVSMRSRGSRVASVWRLLLRLPLVLRGRLPRGRHRGPAKLVNFFSPRASNLSVAHWWCRFRTEAAKASDRTRATPRRRRPAWVAATARRSRRGRGRVPAQSPGRRVLKDDFAEYNLRGQGPAQQFHHGKQGDALKLEDAMDAAILLYSE